jgi:hypothetical protein
MKLMAKNAEEPYQNAFGISVFSLGFQDISDRF